jgi:hypothetical protein
MAILLGHRIGAETGAIRGLIIQQDGAELAVRGLLDPNSEARGNRQR